LRTYVSTHELLAQAEQIVSTSQPSFHNSPLDQITDLVSRGRHYAWIGIYLTATANASRLVGAGGDQPGMVSSPNMKSKVLVSLRMAGREIGVLDVESDRENAFGSEERVFLEELAGLLAHFLTGRGRYLARKARQNPNNSP
jgi:putative methionine-R-sulfoxide reductase with GAF domain